MSSNDSTHPGEAPQMASSHSTKNQGSGIEKQIERPPSP